MDTYDTWLWFVPVEWLTHLFPWRLLGLFLVFLAMSIIHKKAVLPVVRCRNQYGDRPGLLTMVLLSVWSIWATPAYFYTIGSFFVTLYFVFFPDETVTIPGMP